MSVPRMALLKRVRDNVRKDNLTLIAGGVAFFSLLSAIPALAALVSIYGLVADPKDVADRVQAFSTSMPPEAKELLNDQLRSITEANRGGLGAGLVIGLLLALWGASTAMQQLAMALSAVSQVPETRGYVRLRLRALGLTLAGIVFGVIMIGALAVLPFVAGEGAMATAVEVIRWPVVALLMLLALSVLYRFAPDHATVRWRWVSAGSLVATALWLVASALFSFYASQFGSYNKTYGALAGVVILMLWLFITALCVLLGAEIDAARADEIPRETSDEPGDETGDENLEEIEGRSAT